MKSAKNASVTVDTRLTQQNFQHLANSSDKSKSFAQQIEESQNKGNQFLKLKNYQLQQKVRRMSSRIRQLETKQHSILALNAKYVEVVNAYYHSKLALKKGQDHLSLENKQKINGDWDTRTALRNLERDHRNLVKHCLAMEEQITNYVTKITEFNEMKAQLISVNHTSVAECVQELVAVTEENKDLKTENNRIAFELQRAETECKQLRKKRDECSSKANESSTELQKYKSLVRTVQQQSVDKANEAAAKIYQLQIKTEKLEKELRFGQQSVLRTSDHLSKLQLQRVENSLQRSKLRADISQLLNPHHRKSLSLNTCYPRRTAKHSSLAHSFQQQ